MPNLTLKQMCEKFGISRRSVQGYEKTGLVKYSSKTERGYLLYDESAQENVKAIRTMQKFGCSLNEIAVYRELSSKDKISFLQEKRKKLIIQQTSINESLNIITEIIIEKENSYDNTTQTND